jgi:hypothetical protein
MKPEFRIWKEYHPSRWLDVTVIATSTADQFEKWRVRRLTPTLKWSDNSRMMFGSLTAACLELAWWNWVVSVTLGNPRSDEIYRERCSHEAGDDE